jgi:multidrug transporter EmrE-like cation transporter
MSKPFKKIWFVLMIIFGSLCFCFLILSIISKPVDLIRTVLGVVGGVMLLVVIVERIYTFNNNINAKKNIR